MFERRASITAGEDFVGTEFASDATAGALQVHEISLSMGDESKTWAIYKRWTNDAGDAKSVVLVQSEDSGGTPAATADATVLFVPDQPLYLTPGQSIAIITAAATAAMDASVLYHSLKEAS